MASTLASTPMNNPTGSNDVNPPVERRCENADCNASKLLSLVPKRKISQFVIEPNVMEKPMLINGFTTVFQVDGPAAKLSDVKSVPSTGASQPKTIYRIVPNTHAHIVNYVVVDAEGESLRKINESDPATMRKLLESQKVSADQMLKKLIAGVSVAGGSSAVGNNTGSMVVQTPALTVPVIQPAMSTVRPPTAVSSPMITPQIQLPVRMHPNLKITAVASAETVAAMNNQPLLPPQMAPPPAQPISMPPQVPPTLPLITPVPLSALQSPTSASLLRTGSVPMGGPTPPPLPVVDTVEKPVFDKMQAELQELRRTVAMLAEAQAKNQQQQQVTPIPTKRLR